VEALTLSDRVAVLRDGVVQQVATPDGVYGRPGNRFVATFIGSPAMNVVPALLGEDLVRAGPFAVKPAAGLGGRRLELGVRPEHVLVALDGSGPGAPAEVQLVEVAGSETFLHLAAGPHTIVARAGPLTRPPVGARVRIAPAPDRHFLLDADSGATLHP